MTGSYYAFLPVRDCAGHIGPAVTSILEQTRRPTEVTIVDDGSTDGTTEILEGIRNDNPGLVRIISTGNKTRDYSRLVRLWNMCLRPDPDYHLISAGDIILERDHAATILDIMDADPKVAVASGRSAGSAVWNPHGAGRFVRQSFFFDNYTKYPEIVGYESEILWRAKILGYRVMVVDGAVQTHTAPLGGLHNFVEFGYGMRALGYHPLYALGRIMLSRNPRMLWHYIRYRPQKLGYYSRFPAELRSGVRRLQAEMMVQRLLGRARH